MTIDWNAELLDQADFMWNHHFLRRMQGLTDEEYFREPADDCWNVFRNADGRWAVTWDFPEPTPPPVTTIGWRLVHIAIPVFGARASKHFGDGSYSLKTALIPGSAEEAMELLAENYAKWREGVAALGNEGLAQPCGPAEGSFSEAPMASLVLHINREFLHHAAEVMLLRDLYRANPR